MEFTLFPFRAQAWLVEVIFGVFVIFNYYCRHRSQILLLAFSGALYQGAEMPVVFVDVIPVDSTLCGCREKLVVARGPPEFLSSVVEDLLQHVFTGHQRTDNIECRLLLPCATVACALVENEAVLSWLMFCCQVFMEWRCHTTFRTVVPLVSPSHQEHTGRVLLIRGTKPNVIQAARHVARMFFSEVSEPSEEPGPAVESEPPQAATGSDCLPTQLDAPSTQVDTSSDDEKSVMWGCCLDCMNMCTGPCSIYR